MKFPKQVTVFLLPILLVCGSASAQDRVRGIDVLLSCTRPCCRLVNPPCKEPRQTLSKNLRQKMERDEKRLRK